MGEIRPPATRHHRTDSIRSHGGGYEGYARTPVLAANNPTGSVRTAGQPESQSIMVVSRFASNGMLNRNSPVRASASSSSPVSRSASSVANPAARLPPRRGGFADCADYCRSRVRKGLLRLHPVVHRDHLAVHLARRNPYREFRIIEFEVRLH